MSELVKASSVQTGIRSYIDTRKEKLSELYDLAIRAHDVKAKLYGQPTWNESALESAGEVEKAPEGIIEILDSGNRSLQFMIEMIKANLSEIEYAIEK